MRVIHTTVQSSLGPARKYTAKFEPTAWSWGQNDERFRSLKTHFEFGNIEIQTSKAKSSTTLIAESGSENTTTHDYTHPKNPLGLGDPNLYLNTPKPQEYNLAGKVSGLWI